MKILNSSSNDKCFNPSQKSKKISPLFSTLKSHKIVKPKPIFNEHNKTEVEYLKISGELSLTKQSKSIELCKSETSADLSIKNEDSMKFAPAPKASPSKLKILKKRNFVQKEGHFNTGRWQQDEHERFIEAILKFGNEWKKVQKYVKTRSSTQARSHAQKFLYKVNKSNLFDLDINLAKNSLKSLHDLESKLEEEKFANAVRILNHIGFEKNSGSKVRLSSRKIKIPNEDFQTPAAKSGLHFGNGEVVDENVLFSDETLKENIVEVEFSPDSLEDTDDLFKSYCHNPDNKRSRKNSQDFLNFCQGIDISYYDMNNSYFNDFDVEEKEKNFENCFESFFKHPKNNVTALDHEEINELLFVTFKAEILQPSNENSCHEKLDLSVQTEAPPVSLLNKKRKIFQISNAINAKTVVKSNKKIKFVTFNYPAKH